MNKTATSALLYARVSLEVQAEGNSVSIDQQLAEMRALCEKNGWVIAGEYIDTQNYVATQPPQKGKMVNPSGERADRPSFLKMLEAIKTGYFDIVVCWRDDRLVRHPRVDVALEDALDEGDVQRKGMENIKIYDATGTEINKFILSLVSSIWRQENKRRAERGRLGKFATLQEGRWCGEFRRYGYQSIKVQGQRGRIIELDQKSAPIVKRIFEMYDGGYGVAEIRRYLLEIDAPQIYNSLIKHKWSRPLIINILRSPEYMGEARWKFADGTVLKVKIPQIIQFDQWKRVQNRIDRNKVLSTRNAKGVYPLQGLLYCGVCGHLLSVSTMGCYSSFRFGEGEGHAYRCHTSSNNPEENHPKPACYNGVKLDWVLWRFIVDEIIRKPDLAIDQIKIKIRNLKRESQGASGEIQTVEKRLAELSNVRAFYQRKTAIGLMTETEFDARMTETTIEIEQLQSKLARLISLRHDAEQVQRSLDYIYVLFEKMSSRAKTVDIPAESLALLAKDERNIIFQEWRILFRTLINRGVISRDRSIKLYCVVDGSEALMYELGGS
jgi:site-specific DNA recombinase